MPIHDPTIPHMASMEARKAIKATSGLCRPSHQKPTFRAPRRAQVAPDGVSEEMTGEERVWKLYIHGPCIVRRSIRSPSLLTIYRLWAHWSFATDAALALDKVHCDKQEVYDGDNH